MKNTAEKSVTKISNVLRGWYFHQTKIISVNIILNSLIFFCKFLTHTSADQGLQKKWPGQWVKGGEIMSEKLRMLAKSSWWKKGKESLHFGKIVANIMLFIQIRNSTGT